MQKQHTKNTVLCVHTATQVIHTIGQVISAQIVILLVHVPILGISITTQPITTGSVISVEVKVASLH